MELLKGLFDVVLVILGLISWDVCALNVVDAQQNTIRKNVEKPRTLYDYQTRVAAYKDLIDSKCLLEFLTNNESIITQKLADNGNTWKPITTSNQLTKREIWRMAGTRISDFCRGFPTYLIKPLPNTLENQNDLPLIRRKRDERHYFVGRIRGQTQSQYLNFDGTAQPGKAEAESSLEGTKAVVTGTNGMGQAQSQSVPIDCSACFSGRYQDQTLLHGRQPPESLTRPEYSALRPGYRYTGSPSAEGFETSHPTGPGRTSNAEGSFSSGRPGERYRPGQDYPPGSYPIGPGRSRGGTFGGRLSGEYQSHAGQSGKFAGTFEGIYHSEDISERGQLGGVRQTGESISQGPDYSPQPPPGRYDGTVQAPGQEGYPERFQHEPERGTGTQPQSGQWAPGRQWVSPPSSVERPGGQRISGQWLPPEGQWAPSSTGPSSITQPGLGAPSHWKPSGTGGPGSSPSGPQGPTGQFGIQSGPGQWIDGKWLPYSSGPGSPGGGPQVGQWAPTEGAGRSEPRSTGVPGQWIDGKWVPTTGGPGGTTQTGPQESQWVPATRGEGAPSRQWVDGTGQTGAQGGQWISGKWAPSADSERRPEGRWVDGKWTPSTSGTPGQIGPEAQGGRWVDGKWQPSSGSPSGITQTGAGAQGQWVPRPGGTTQTGGGSQSPAIGPSSGGQWIDGKWVPFSRAASGTVQTVGGSPGGTGVVPSIASQKGPEGQWIDGKWVPGPGGTTHTGGGSQGPEVGPSSSGQWIDGKWVPFSGAPSGTVQTIGTGVVPSLTSQRGPEGQWVDGKWVPSPGSVTEITQTGAGTQAGQWVDGKWVPSGVSSGPPGQWGSPSATQGGQWVPPTSGQGAGTGPGSPRWSTGQWTQPGTQGQWTPGAAGTGAATSGAGQLIPSGPGGTYGVPPSAQGPAGSITSASGGVGGGAQIGPGGQWIPGQQPYGTGGSYQSGTGYISPGGGYYSGPGQVPPGQYVQAGQGPGQYIQAGQGPGQWIDGKWVPTEEGIGDDADSQVLTSVQQTNNESITASAQAEGKFQGVTSKSQVSGTYSGTGSFSASAGSDDGKRGALTQVSGGKDGALSSAQGRGGVGQSQAEVSLDAETGDTLSSAQTSGKQHGTQTQVHASEKGGLADAQANGPGPTSSQAQIGFTPYDGQDDDNQTSPFKGSGTAAAQSGTSTGMTQTQIQGKFRYGIRYQGAAQAGAGSTALRNLTEPTGFFKPLNFTSRKINATKHKGESQSKQAAVVPPPKRIELPSTIGNSSSVAKSPKPAKNSTETGINREVHAMRDDDQVVISPSETTIMPGLDEEPEYVDEDYEEEEEEEEEETSTVTPGATELTGPSRRHLEPSWAGQQRKASVVRQDDNDDSLEPHHNNHQKQHIVLEGLDPARSVQPEPSVVSQSDAHQKQHIVLDPLEDLDATVHQHKGEPVDGMVLQPGQVIPGSPGFQIPAGFRGKVTAIANGPNTYAVGKNAQAQSVTLSPGSGKIYYSKPSNPVYGVVTKTTYKNGQYGTGYSYQPIYHPVGYRVRSGRVLPNFVSVSKSEAGSTDLTTGRRRPDVYYTQSSSCGMFTNTCVYTNGRKTCFPVRKTNPDGTPMDC